MRPVGDLLVDKHIVDDFLILDATDSRRIKRRHSPLGVQIGLIFVSARTFSAKRSPSLPFIVKSASEPRLRAELQMTTENHLVSNTRSGGSLRKQISVAAQICAQGSPGVADARHKRDA